MEIFYNHKEVFENTITALNLDPILSSRILIDEEHNIINAETKGDIAAIITLTMANNINATATKDYFYSACKSCGTKMYPKAVNTKRRIAHFCAERHETYCANKTHIGNNGESSNSVPKKVEKIFIIDMLQNELRFMNSINIYRFEVLKSYNHKFEVHKHSKKLDLQKMCVTDDTPNKILNCVVIIEFILNEKNLEFIKNNNIYDAEDFYFFDLGNESKFKVYFSEDAIEKMKLKLSEENEVKVYAGTIGFSSPQKALNFNNWKSKITSMQIVFSDEINID